MEAMLFGILFFSSYSGKATLFLPFLNYVSKMEQKKKFHLIPYSTVFIAFLCTSGTVLGSKFLHHDLKMKDSYISAKLIGSMIELMLGFKLGFKNVR